MVQRSRISEKDIKELKWCPTVKVNWIIKWISIKATGFKSAIVSWILLLFRYLYLITPSNCITRINFISFSRWKAKFNFVHVQNGKKWWKSKHSQKKISLELISIAIAFYLIVKHTQSSLLLYFSLWIYGTYIRVF